MIKGSKHSLESREKMREWHLKNPQRFWLGKKLPEYVLEKKRIAGKSNPNIGYFKTHIFKGANHGNWKGDKVGYDALHAWIYRELGNPDTCEFCKKSGLKGGSIQWANKSGSYKREFSDWLRLCAKCHYAYDRY